VDGGLRLDVERKHGILAAERPPLLLSVAIVLVIFVLAYLRRSMGRATGAKLPQSLRLKGASFYDAVDSISNVAAGTRNGSEYVLLTMMLQEMSSHTARQCWRLRLHPPSHLLPTFRAHRGCISRGLVTGSSCWSLTAQSK
jgi:hypothetical protein